jgi:hypothetical protein
MLLQIHRLRPGEARKSRQCCERDAAQTHHCQPLHGDSPSTWYAAMKSALSAQILDRAQRAVMLHCNAAIEGARSCFPSPMLRCRVEIARDCGNVSPVPGYMKT